jgi:pantothenate kinase
VEEPAATPVPPELLERATALAAGPGRAVLGITGVPGAGKSTLADALVAALGDRAVLVPMDGFHLADTELRRLGRADRKGAPDTFDAAGYVHLLRRLVERTDEVVHAPVFRRELELAEAGALPVPRATPLVVTEGNYLLLDGPFAPVRALLTQCWYVDVDPGLRLARLVARHERHGRSPAAARAWVERSDEPNARLVEATRERADLVVRLG